MSLTNLGMLQASFKQRNMVAKRILVFGHGWLSLHLLVWRAPVADFVVEMASSAGGLDPLVASNKSLGHVVCVEAVKYELDKG